MGFLDSIERLITEHGSAAILKERIQLLNDQHAAVERKLKESEAKVLGLESANATLKAQLQALQSEVDEVRRLQQKADGQGQQQASDERMRVLRSICLHPDCGPTDVAADLGISADRAQWHLDALAADKLAFCLHTAATFYSPAQQEWTVTTTGRDLLFARGLID